MLTNLSSLLGLICLLWSLTACTPGVAKDSTSPNYEPLPNRSSLQHLAWNNEQWLLLYPEQDEAALQSIIAKFANATTRGPELLPISIEAVPDSMLQQYPAMIWWHGADVKKQLPLASLPDLYIDSTLRLGNTTIEDQNALAIFTYLPGKQQQPTHLYWANNQQQLLKFLSTELAPTWPRSLWSSWGYQVRKGDIVEYQGYFNDTTWQMDKVIHYDLSIHPQLVYETSAIKLWRWSNLKETDIVIANSIQQTITELEDVFDQRASTQIDIYLHESAEQKALRTRKMQTAHCEEENGNVHLIENSFFQGSRWGEQYRPILRSWLGEAASENLEQGLALQFVKVSKTKAWRHYVPKLKVANSLPHPRDFTQSQLFEYEPVSGLFAIASWLEFLQQKLEQAAFLDYYKTGKLPALEQFHQDWLVWLELYPSENGKQYTIPKERLNGFTLAHEGYRVFNGYGGQLTRLSLQSLTALGTNATSIVPYSYMRHPRRPSPIPVIQDAGAENDVSVVHAHQVAKERAMFTMLKPQIWINGAWPGDVDFDTDEEWEQFFTHYHKWAIHYALIADLYQFDAYCIGTEFRHATLKKPAAWQRLIADIRKVYSGPLTYAANWGEECEQLTFWPALDFIGVNSYYPLHKEEQASPQQLQAGAERVVNKIKQLHQANQRPVWLTEVGFRSATAPWQHPHAEAGNRAIDEEAQAQCYEALLGAMEGEEEWLQGMFWWKWPCYLSHEESRGRGYMPLGKPAAEVVKRYF